LSDGGNPSFGVELGVLPNEAQRDELGEPAGLHLDLSQQIDVARDVAGRLDVSVHDRGRGGKPERVSRSNDLDPVGRRQFLVRENFANVIVENLGCRTRHAA